MAGPAANDPQRDVRSDMRASDSDRERVAGVLRRAVDEGRLDLTEYDDRLRAVYEAKTYGELAPITHDLPAPPPPRPAVATPASAPSPKRHHPLSHHWRSWVTVSVIVTAIWLFSSIGAGSFHGFWPIWVIGPWGVMLAFRAFGGHAGATHHHRRRVRC